MRMASFRPPDAGSMLLRQKANRPLPAPWRDFPKMVVLAVEAASIKFTIVPTLDRLM